MGVISRIFGLGRVVKDVAEVFVPNKTDAARHHHIERVANYDQFAQEFEHQRAGWFDRFVNALNRLPRPVLALGTVGLFIYAMIDPAGFGLRMRGLQLVPEPLWWLLGAIVSFYFGARELHYARDRSKQGAVDLAEPTPLAEENAALSELIGSEKT